jgi:hypothetical protein
VWPGLLQPAHDAPDGLERERPEEGRGKGRAKALEDLHGFGTGIDLRDQVGGRGRDKPVDEGAHELGVAIGDEPGRRLVGRALAGDHVAGDRPGRSAKAEQGRLRRQGALDAAEGFEHRRQALERH